MKTRNLLRESRYLQNETGFLQNESDLYSIVSPNNHKYILNFYYYIMEIIIN
jgi:hypothetical protein